MTLYQVCILITLLNCYLIHFECKIFYVIIHSYMTYEKFSLMVKEGGSWILYPILIYLVLQNCAICKYFST